MKSLSQKILVKKYAELGLPKKDVYVQSLLMICYSNKKR